MEFEHGKNHDISNSCLIEGLPLKQYGYFEVFNMTSLAIFSYPIFYSIDKKWITKTVAEEWLYKDSRWVEFKRNLESKFENNMTI